MTDTLLTLQDQEEALSYAYVQAVASMAGYTYQMANLDRDGVDLSLSAGGAMKPRLDLQLKATASLMRDDDQGNLCYPLKVRNYDLLREITQAPRLLVVLQLPPQQEEWLTLSPQQLTLRQCTYWVSLKGAISSNNTTSVTVAIPKQQRFTVEALKQLMALSRQGRL
jgi:hypothetical protein